MRSSDEIRGIVEGYATSGMTRREYCEKHGISISTLDYWRRKQHKKPKLVEVAIETQPAGRFAGGGSKLGVSPKPTCCD
jgi:transposase-like protein